MLLQTAQVWSSKASVTMRGRSPRRDLATRESVVWGQAAPRPGTFLNHSKPLDDLSTWTLLSLTFQTPLIWKGSVSARWHERTQRFHTLENQKHKSGE
jgi:hypothetical protein